MDFCVCVDLFLIDDDRRSVVTCRNKRSCNLKQVIYLSSLSKVQKCSVLTAICLLFLYSEGSSENLYMEQFSIM